jgi:hypothetical protein
LSHIRREARAAGGETYLKSRDIAAELDVGPRQVGIRLAYICRHADIPLDIEKWGCTNAAATWRASVSDNGELVDYIADIESEPTLGVGSW